MSTPVLENKHWRIEIEYIDWTVKHYSLTLKDNGERIIINEDQIDSLRLALNVM